jgi:hypothetical protein
MLPFCSQRSANTTVLQCKLRRRINSMGSSRDKNQEPIVAAMGYVPELDFVAA